MKHNIWGFIILLSLVLGGCATFHSEIDGYYGGETEKSLGLEPVDVLFVSRHLQQTTGLDAVPKLQHRWKILDGYDDILLDATREFSNLSRYAAYTEFSSDMSDNSDKSASLLSSSRHRCTTLDFSAN